MRVTTVLVLVVMALPATAVGQSGGASDVPRTPWGAPDLGGNWVHSSLTPLERPAALGDRAVLTAEEEEAFVEQQLALLDQFFDLDLSADIVDMPEALSEGRTSLVVDPITGRLPARTDAGEQRMATVGAPPFSRGVDHPEDRNLIERCVVLESVPLLIQTIVVNLWLFQTPDHVVVFHEANHETRIIPLDRRPRLASNVSQWRGSSRGRYESDTLVVETTNFHPEWTLMGSGPNLVLTERFTRADADTLRYSYTVTDPESFTDSWTVEVAFDHDADGVVYEFACHEGNRSMELMLSGGRALDRQEAAER